MEKLELEVGDLLLDLENPRLVTVETQAEALEALIELDPNHFKNMMRSIKEHGLDPGDAFYVLASEDEDGDYVVVDGNRRVAALQVLNDPAILQGTTLGANAIKLIAKVADGFNPAATKFLSAVLFDNRETANEWIMRRHGRSMDGEGRITWGPLEIDRFKRERTTLDVIDFVERNSTFPDDVWKQIKHSVENAPYVLRRLLDSKRGREWLGMTVRAVDGAKVPYFDRSPEFVIDLLSRLFVDINAKHVDTRRLNKASEVEDYFEALPDELHPEENEKRTEAQAFKDAVVKNKSGRPRLGKGAAAKVAKGKTVRTSPPRSTLAPSRHTFTQPATEKGRQLLREASKLRLREYPLGCAYILRSFLEHTVDTYMSQESLPFHENNKQLELRIRAERVIKHLIANKKVKSSELQGVKTTLTSKSDPASIHSLNSYHHDRYHLPATDVLRNAWESAIPLYVAVYGKV
jgi:hypothetical protein